MQNVQTFSVPYGGMDLSFEVGKYAFQADGSAMIKWGDVAILSTVGIGAARPGMGFFPLVVEFEPKFYAAGKFKHSRVNKREGRRSDRDILQCRVADRPLRPMFPKDTRSEVQVINTLLQTDGQYLCAPLSITAASLCIQLSGVPFEQSVAGVHVGKDENGNLMAGPTFEQAEKNGLDLIVAGTADAITMVEAGADMVTNAEMIEALEFAHAEIKRLCQAQDDFLKTVSINPRALEMAETSDSLEAAKKAVAESVTEADLSTVRGATKREVKEKMHALEETLFEKYASEIEAETINKSDLVKCFEKAFAKNMRQGVFTDGKRVDGRAIDEVRILTSEVGVFDRLHGTGLFQRGETQVLTTLTVSGPDDYLHVSDADRPEFLQNYIHHYNFPPYSVGETRPLRGPGRREIGHGALAERALSYVIPKMEDDYRYMIRAVSEVLSCNGSSSMASVCGSTLALMDGGIPIKAPIAGIAMGLLMDEDTGDYRILTDIQGLEDFDGDMDFKVAGDQNRISCLQLDIKIKGLDLSLLKEALERAEVARNEILESMLAAIPESRAEMSPFAPQIKVIKVAEKDIAKVIGKGGDVIQGMQADFEVQISIEDDGTTVITGLEEGIEKTVEMIEKITYKPKEGDRFEDCEVKGIQDFGAFVEYTAGQQGLVHVSEIAKERVEDVNDHLKLGDKVTVKIIGVDERSGKVKLSMKQA